MGLILCADKGHALARYALDGLPTKVMAANYRTVLPDGELLQKELENTRRLLESRGGLSIKDDEPPGVPPSGSRAAPRASCRITAIRR